MGENNRHNLAANFLTPVTWQFYCDNITKSSNCTDSVANGPPLNAAEGVKYHQEDSYTGYFYTPPDGNCTINPETCTGHFVNCPCSWATYGDAQMYWNNITLTSRGPSKGNNGYSDSAIKEIWAAANETKNNVLMWWWYPDSLLEKYEGTEARFHRIHFPKPTQKCLRWRRKNIARCSEEDGRRRGADAITSCDYPVEKVMKLFSRSLKDMNDNTPEAERSPAFPLMQKIRVKPYVIDELLSHWVEIKKDFYGYDSREATCKWVYDNLEMLIKEQLPKGYPRQINQRRSIPLVITSYILASMALIIIFVVAVLIFKFKDRHALKYVQVEFLFWDIAGTIIVFLIFICLHFGS